MEGLSTGTLHGKLGIRAGNTGLINMDDVRVPVEHRIGEEGEGFLIAMSAIDQGRYTVAAGQRRARRRRASTRRSSTPTSARRSATRSASTSSSSRCSPRWSRASRPAGCSSGAPGFLKNHGVRNTRETSLAKWYATDHAVASALDAIQIHGANGYSNEFPVERYLRNSKAAVIYEGTSQLHTLIQADYALGYREDRPLRCEPLPAEGFERLPASVAAAAGRA